MGKNYLYFAASFVPFVIVLHHGYICAHQSRYLLVMICSHGHFIVLPHWQPGDQAASNMTWYPTQSDYPEIVLTSPCPILLMMNVGLASDKYHWLDLAGIHEKPALYWFSHHVQCLICKSPTLVRHFNLHALHACSGAEVLQGRSITWCHKSADSGPHWDGLPLKCVNNNGWQPL